MVSEIRCCINLLKTLTENYNSEEERLHSGADFTTEENGQS